MPLTHTPRAHTHATHTYTTHTHIHTRTHTHHITHTSHTCHSHIHHAHTHTHTTRTHTHHTHKHNTHTHTHLIHVSVRICEAYLWMSEHTRMYINVSSSLNTGYITDVYKKVEVNVYMKLYIKQSCVKHTDFDQKVLMQFVFVCCKWNELDKRWKKWRGY